MMEGHENVQATTTALVLIRQTLNVPNRLILGISYTSFVCFLSRYLCNK